MSSWTPGPWIIDDDNGDLSIYVPSDRGLRYVISREIGGEIHQDANGKYTDYSTVDANARLIAASPELLEALIGMLSIHDSVTMGQEREFREKWVPIAREAIAKATQP